MGVKLNYVDTYTQTSSYNNTLESLSYRAILHLDHLISVYPKCIMGSISVSLDFFCLFQEAILEIPEHKADAKNLNNEIVKWVQDNCAGIPSHELDELDRFTGIPVVFVSDENRSKSWKIVESSMRYSRVRPHLCTA